MDNSLYNRHNPSGYGEASPFRMKQPSNLNSGRKDSRGRYPQRNEREEEEYHRRREEEIKRQLMDREAELRNAQQRHVSPPVRDHSDPRQSNWRQDPHQRGISPNQPERDRSPYGMGVSRDMQSSANFPPHLKDHVQNLQNDNTGLMRRLNLVLQELDRVQKEKEELHQRTTAKRDDILNLQRILDGENKVDKVNNYLQDDLTYERDRNLKVRGKIKEEEMYTNDLLRELRKTENDQEIGMHENQNLSANTQKKTAQIADLEKEIYFTQEKIRQVQNDIERTKMSEMNTYADKADLDRVIQSLLRERSDLLARLDNLTRKYDECVREISYDRAEMERHNKHHAKLITAKIIFFDVDQMKQNRMKEAFQELKQYCKFDNNCHQKLSRLAKIFERLGVYKIKNAFTQWYSNGLDPIRCKAQAANLAVKVHSDNLKSQMFYIWRARYIERMDSYDNKTRSIQAVWDIKMRDSNVEKKRAFFIWKESLKKFKQKQQRVQKLIYKLYFSKLNQAFNAWINHSDNINTQVRFQILTNDFSRKQYMTVMFHNFRYQTTEAHRKRHNYLQHIWKAWKDYLSYKKYLLGANVSVMQFVKECDSTVLKQCFDSWKQFKQKKILEKTHANLYGNELVKISELTNEIENKQTDNKFKGKNMACECIKTMMSKKLYIYFQQWRDANTYYKEQMRTSIKERIIKSYKLMLRSAFNLWLANRSSVTLEMHTLEVDGLQSNSNELQSQIFDLQKDIKEKTDQKDCSQKKNLLKCVASFERRQKELAIGRWRDNCNNLETLQDGASTIIKRLRLSLLRQAFNLYLAGTRYHKKREIEEKRIVLYRQTRNMRLLTKTYRAWDMFRNDFVRAKLYWNRIYCTIDCNMKSKAMKSWKQKTALMAEQEAKEIQNENIEKLDNLNQEMGGLQNTNENEKQVCKDLNNQMKKQAKRILSNYFARFYYIGETRGIEKWKQFVQDQQRKEQLMKKMLNHWRKYQFFQVKSCFRNWMKNADVQEKRDILKKEEQRLADLKFQHEQQTKSYKQASGALCDELEGVYQVQSKFNDRVQKQLQNMTNRALQNDFMSNRRYIFQQWKHYVKREVQFLKCIENVISKSLWTRALKRIKNKALLVEKDRKKAQFLNKIRMRVWQRFCGDAMTKWKTGCFFQMNGIIDELNKETNAIKAEHKRQIDVAKGVNAFKAGMLLEMRGLKDYYKAWIEVTKQIKLFRLKSEILIDEYQVLKQKNAIKKWHQRKEATEAARSKITQNVEKYKRIHTYIYFREWRARFKAGKNFIVRIANFASIHDHQALKMALNAILTHSKGEKVKSLKKKGFATNEIFNLMNNLVKDRKRKYLYDLKLRTANRYKQSVNKAHILVYWLTKQARDVIQHWKRNAEGQTLQKESYEEGPIREEFLEQRQQLRNLQNFMKDEGYNKKEIQDNLNKGKDDLKNLMLRAVRRLEHYNPELNPKPKAWDRWKLFVYYRKAFRYWLDFVNSRCEFGKGDLKAAFNKWKHMEDKHKTVLSRMCKNDLEKEVMKNNTKLDEFANHLDDKENRIGHLCNQRDALLENYVKGQKLALSIWRNNSRYSMEEAINRWKYKIIEEKVIAATQIVKENVVTIAEAKDQINQLEQENEDLANENEELRQFSLDGYEIAKSVQALAGEREKLSVDLADKAQIIRKLLDENEKLTAKLKMAQQEVQSLINTTNKKGGYGSPQSRAYR